MAQLHVNSTTGGTPTSPYDTWAKAATTIGAAVAAAVAGDEIFVHPSHVETATAGLNMAVGTNTNPVKIICGTPDTVSGITALQNTAIWSYNASGTVVSLQGSFYVRGIVFKILGATGSGGLTFNLTASACSTLEDCQLRFDGAAGVMNIGPSTGQDGITVLNNCSFRWGASGETIRLNNRVVGNNWSVIAGSVTPTTMFTIGNPTGNISAIVRVDGLNLTELANTTRLVSAFGRLSVVRFRNIVAPSGWAADGDVIAGTELLPGSELEVLNFGDGGDTNHRFIIEDKQGRASSEDTIKVTGASASGNSTATYSKRLMTYAGVTYPNSVFRGPSVTKYVAANGLFKSVSVSIAHDGATAFTNKQFWFEVSFRGVSGSSLATVATSCPSYITAATTLSTSIFTWTGFTEGVTTGPNGSSTWHKLYAFVGGLAVMEDGWVTVTPCMAVPSKTLFMNDDFLLQDEGSIP